jgi:23S rRNA (adenine2030-N6)-methyltransferase
MNYRHAYHAGNFADVLKHAVLALVLDYMKRKPAPFRVVDTHAGAGRYALTGVEAGKTGEWRSGIGRLLGPEAASLPQAAAQLLQPYLDCVRKLNSGSEFEAYPGSPLIALSLMRNHDTLIANELHPEEHADLKATVGADRRCKATALDAWVALKALLPPKERRGVILVDPPFEEPRELERMAEGLRQGLQRFATGIYLAWYPIKDPKPVARFHAGLDDLAARELLRIELMIQPASDPERLNGSGVIVANPPYTLARDLAVLLPELSRRLAAGPGGGYRLDRIGSPQAATGRPGSKSPAQEGRRKRPFR